MAMISRACALAFHAMMCLPEPGRPGVPLREMADALNVSSTSLAKVMQSLARGRLVKSTRGPRGGFVLARAADTIRMGDVYEAVNGRFQPATCLLDRPCCLGTECCMSAVTHEMNRLLGQFLAQTRLSDTRRKFKLGEAA